MSGLAGLSRGTQVPICPDTLCDPWDRDRDRTLQDERDRDTFSRDCPVPSLAHPCPEGSQDRIKKAFLNEKVPLKEHKGKTKISSFLEGQSGCTQTLPFFWEMRALNTLTELQRLSVLPREGDFFLIRQDV